MTTIKTALTSITSSLNSDCARLDAELIITHVLSRDRSYIYAHPEFELSSSQLNKIHKLAAKRDSGVPMAYLLGKQEFWSLDLKVTPNVLIPRPETEHVVEWVLTTFAEKKNITIADLGTGSGAIAIALAFEKPHWKIIATDKSVKTLAVAKENATSHQTNNIIFVQGNWFEPLINQKFDLIISNPPYIANKDPHLNNLKHEPLSALVSGEEGLDDIKTIIQQATRHLKASGYLAIEHGYQQQAAITQLLQNNHYQKINTHSDLAKLPRFTTAVWRQYTQNG